ncbi:hypothetical protein LAZ67_9001865 [Cordylochernes scorpioides]|uniref:Reverse transcriptase domain-containing protein n=1 Tax=Cordylochernes scorpioides TaxID=51811 RepID=A0ABY6KTV8_9ARAC|nr:hypothetical protein LAZ67_9001865 [Cordylochernes scorpioides]
MTEILNDHTTFIPIAQSDVSTSVKSFRLKLLRLKKSGHITPVQYSSFISDLNNVPYIYGLPKTHKPGIPLRPIIAYHLSPAYKLSKYLSSYLTPLVKASPQSSAIRDIPSFVQSVNSLSPAPNSVMVSYDVNSMYLSLPHQLIIRQFTKFLQDSHVDPHTTESIIALSSLCLDFTTFTFNNLYYKQIRGSPMGSPLSSPLAEIVMATIDHWIQQQITPGIHMWRKYIDDIFSICDTGQKINILDCLNSYHPEISFSLELEDRSVLPFLDILVIRTTSHYHTTVYHKINNPTFYTDFNSSCPLSHKINTVRTLTKRLVTHCSLPLFRTIEFSLIIKQLALSQYPPHFIHKYRYNPLSVRPATVSRNSCLLPFSAQSVAISRILRTHGINTYFSNSKSIGAILRHPITRLPRSTVAQSSGGSVYSVSCNDCSASYIGETGRSVAIRMTEHGRCITNKDNRSLIFNHIDTTGHSFNLSSPTTLYSNISTANIKELIKLCLEYNYFSFKDQFFRHIKGLPMGNPISSALANIFMHHIDQIVTESKHLKLISWQRYIDNIFCITESEISIFLNFFNNLKPFLKFTHEIEINNSLAFLDIQINKKQNKIEISIYRKCTHTGNYLNFNSFGPVHHKTSVVNTLSKRLTTHCSMKNDENMERNRIFKDLKNNDYPDKFIKKHLYKPKFVQSSNSSNQSKRFYCTFPYSYGSERIARFLRHPDTKQISKLENKNNVIYKIPCNDCPAKYIGETSKPLKDRINQHKSGLRNYNPLSLLVDHALKNNHTLL